MKFSGRALGNGMELIYQGVPRDRAPHRHRGRGVRRGLLEPEAPPSSVRLSAAPFQNLLAAVPLRFHQPARRLPAGLWVVCRVSCRCVKLLLLANELLLSVALLSYDTRVVSVISCGVLHSYGCLRLPVQGNSGERITNARGRRKT